VLHFCQENKLAAKALLLDNATGYPANLAELRTCLAINVVYMPPNTTSVLQPMDQEVIATFTAYYLYQTIMEIVRVLVRSDNTIKDYWHLLHILKGTNNIKAKSVGELNGVVQMSPRFASGEHC
jgi:hypothetical protein